MGFPKHCSNIGCEWKAKSRSEEGGEGARRPLHCWHRNAGGLGEERLPQRLPWLLQEPWHQPQFQLPRVLPSLLGQQ